MRVITGTAKGKKLIPPKDERVRPTSDRVKQSLFNIIDPLIKNSVFIDCFSGSGAIGIEALSRGAKEVYFIDNNRDSIQLIQRNLELTQLQDKGKILQMDVETAITSIANNKVFADIIFMDPPYKLDIITQLVMKISRNRILSEAGIIIAEHDKSYLPDKVILDYAIYDARTYGTTVMTYYQKSTLDTNNSQEKVK